MALMIDKQKIFETHILPHLNKVLELCVSNDIPYVMALRVRDHISEEDTMPLYAYVHNPDPMIEFEDDNLLKELVERIKEEGLELD